MVTLRSEAKEEQTQQLETSGKDVQVGDLSEYELSREERIKQNKERMQKLGILNLSQKLMPPKSVQKRASCRKIDLNSSPFSNSGIVRRSSRLQESTPVTYRELATTTRNRSLLREESEFVNKRKLVTEYRKLLREGGPKPEIYTEEHEKLLGGTERNWTLFVDGYGKDGKRIYDSIQGKTCHQCRQKTLGHHTHCRKCNFRRGQFCGDCLYMRYGEHVLEANENPNWTCPCCRDICNCSFCRQAKGWPPTGTLYRKISQLGYKSVAHYLVQTQRHVKDSDKNTGTKVPVSAKRSLPFSDTELTVEEGDHSESNVADSPRDTEVPVSAKQSLQFPDTELTKEEGDLSESSGVDFPPESANEFGTDIIPPEGGPKPLQEPALATQLNDEAEYALKHDPSKIAAESNKDHEGDFLVNLFQGSGYETTEMKIDETNASDSNDVVAPETSPQTLKKRIRIEPSPDSIAGRLRKRRMPG